MRRKCENTRGRGGERVLDCGFDVKSDRNLDPKVGNYHPFVSFENVFIAWLAVDYLV